MAELVDALDLGSSEFISWEFESLCPHIKIIKLTNQKACEFWMHKFEPTEVKTDLKTQFQNLILLGLWIRQ